MTSSECLDYDKRSAHIIEGASVCHQSEWLTCLNYLTRRSRSLLYQQNSSFCPQPKTLQSHYLWSGRGSRLLGSYSKDQNKGSYWKETLSQSKSIVQIRKKYTISSDSQVNEKVPRALVWDIFRWSSRRGDYLLKGRSMNNSLLWSTS